MGFTMVCTNKGCFQTQEPYLNLHDNKVYCSLCEKEIINVSVFTKNQMKNLKQFKVKKPTPFAVKCPSCSKEEQPKLLKDEIVCGSCSKPLSNLSAPFKMVLKEKLKNAKSDI